MKNGPQLAWSSFALQIALVLGGLAALALYPPREGAMALVALDGRDAGRLVGPALDGGAMLLARGPLSNILIVRGDRSRLAAMLPIKDVLIVAAPRRWCGEAEPRA